MHTVPRSCHSLTSCYCSVGGMETSLHNPTCQEIIALLLPLESPKILELNLCVEWNHNRDQGRLLSLAEFTQLKKLGVTSKFRGRGCSNVRVESHWALIPQQCPVPTRGYLPKYQRIGRHKVSTDPLSFSNTSRCHSTPLLHARYRSS